MASAPNRIGAGSLAKTDPTMLPFIPKWEHKGMSQANAGSPGSLVFLLNRGPRQILAGLDPRRERGRPAVP